MTKCVRSSLLSVIFFALSSMPLMGQEEHRQPAPAKPPVQSPELGQLDGTYYSNNFFGLSLSVPKEWVVVDAQRNQALDDQAKKMVNSPDPKHLERVEGSLERSKTLLRIMKLPEGQPNNAMFMLIAERLASPDLKTGHDVVAAMQQTMKDTNFTVEMLEAARTEKLGTVDFALANIKVSSPIGAYKQRIYIMVYKDYALELFFTYLDDADLPAIDAITKSVKFK
jgi:hypothetical protein